jgi:hypothetical protein
MEKYESYETGGNSWASSHGNYISGQSFTPLVAHNLTRVVLWMKRLGTPPGYRIRLYLCDGAHKPTESELTGVDVDLSGVTTDPAGEWVAIDLPSYPVLQGTEYGLLSWPYGGNSDNQVQWYCDNIAPTYTRGLYLYSSNGGSSWAAYPTADLLFQEWGGPEAAPFSKVHVIG